MVELNRLYFAIDAQADKSFFIVEKSVDHIRTHRLQDKIQTQNKDANFKDDDLSGFYFCFSDPSCFENAGWPLRLFLVALVHLW